MLADRVTPHGPDFYPTLHRMVNYRHHGQRKYDYWRADCPCGWTAPPKPWFEAEAGAKAHANGYTL